MYKITPRKKQILIKIQTYYIILLTLNSWKAFTVPFLIILFSVPPSKTPDIQIFKCIGKGKDYPRTGHEDPEWE